MSDYDYGFFMRREKVEKAFNDGTINLNTLADELAYLTKAQFLAGIEHILSQKAQWIHFKQVDKFLSLKQALQQGTFNFFTQIAWDATTQILTYTITQYTLKEYVAGYRQSNNRRYPIMGLKLKQKIAKQATRKLTNLNRFLQTECLDLPVKTGQLFYLFASIGQKPDWFTALLEKLALSDEISADKASLVELETELTKWNKTTPYQLFRLKPIRLSLWGSKFWRKVASFFTFKKLEARIWRNYVNAEIKVQNKAWNGAELAKQTDWLNKKKAELQAQINVTETKIATKTAKLAQLDTNKVAKKQNIVADDVEWFDLRDSFDRNFLQLNHLKGVYVIWDKTKDKYYVGQTKNIYRRLFSQHFSAVNHKCLNPLFLADFDAGDAFYFRWQVAATKDELDDLERNLIAYYHAFETGYNKTRGNE